jgi:TolA-binding protein
MRKTDARISFRLNKIAVACCLAAVFTIAACSIDRPNPELVTAREAFAAATEVDSAKYAPANYHKAEETYRRAMGLYKEQRYKDAIKEFRLARSYAERAENAARIQRQKSGEEGL